MTALTDQAARDRIAQDTGSTLFVNAGAGSGKTTALVDRVCTLVTADGVRLANIAAVTFTEKAGAELRDRLRGRFEQICRDGGAAAGCAQQALDDLDAAAIGTLHSFAQRILTEHPIAAELPPILEVLDEVGSSIAFDARWAELQAQLLDDDSVARALLIAMALGSTLKDLRALTLALGFNWDLIADRVLRGAAELDPPDAGDLVDRARVLLVRRESCTDCEDKLLTSFDTLAGLVAQFDDAPDEQSGYAVLQDVADLTWPHGRKANWNGQIDAIKAEGKQLAQDAGDLLARVKDQCLRHLTRWLGQRVLDAARTRRTAGRLEFHDLLVLAREMLRRDAAVRAALHEDYQRLLLDEFQDTDPIQIELAARICGGAAATAERWQDIVIPPGRLFVVGDAKQSIYRFRRASIKTYLQARRHLGAELDLTSNFRTLSPILDWINSVFGNVIVARPDAQPDYLPLACARQGTADGPAVTVLGADAHVQKLTADGLRELEARDVAAAVHTALAERWTVWDGQAWRPARLTDIAVLVPARTSLPFLEDALDEAAIPYRAEASSLVYQAGEVRDLLSCTRALADTSDALALVSALRSPLFGCGDDDLWEWARCGGRFSVFAEVDGPAADNPVGQALRYLKALYFDCRWLTPSEVLGRLIADRRMYELAATGPRYRDVWRRLRFVVDQARAWSEASPGGLRAYLAWAAHQGSEMSRVTEAVLPETDADAVRVMTIHAAKGLEFPIVILSGMTARARNPTGVRLVWPPDGGYEIRIKKVATENFDVAAPIEEQFDACERRRLLYVAATRARDHLVVSLHRCAGAGYESAAGILAECGATAAGAVPLPTSATTAVPRTLVPSAAAPSAPSGSAAAPAPAAPTAAQLTEDLARIERARARTRADVAVTASGLEGTAPPAVLDADTDPGWAGLFKAARDLDLPPWTKGRYGSAIGRAVHAVLQVVDLRSGDLLEQAVRAQAVAEAVTGQEDVVRALVRSALASPVVQRAAQRDSWRETYVGYTREDGVLVEGYLDLLYREDDGSLRIVDYKTDAVPAAAVPARVGYYRPQMDAYLAALRAGTDAAVSATLLFLNPAGAIAVDLPPG